MPFDHTVANTWQRGCKETGEISPEWLDNVTIVGKLMTVRGIASAADRLLLPKAQAKRKGVGAALLRCIIAVWSAIILPLCYRCCMFFVRRCGGLSRHRPFFVADWPLVGCSGYWFAVFCGTVFGCVGDTTRGSAVNGGSYETMKHV